MDDPVVKSTRNNKIFMYFIILLIPVLAIGMTIKGYNTIQINEEYVKAAWGDVESVYQRRFDLIPNLVEVVKASAAHEKETLTAVTEARAKIGQLSLGNDTTTTPSSLAEFQAAQTGLTSALSRLLVVIEKYPTLKANQDFRNLQSQLEGTENRINVARKRFNDTVMSFNSSIRVFPNEIVNNLFLNLPRREPFKAESGATKSVKIKF